MKKYLIPITLLFCFLVSSCLDMDDIEDPNTVFTLGFDIDEGVGNDFIMNGDTLVLIGAKFIIDNIELEASGDNEVFASNNVLVQISGFGIGDGFQVGNSEIFGGNYTGVKYDLTTADTNSDLNDTDLIVRNEEGIVIDRFSFAINGVYNNEPFLFKSRLNTQINIDFEENVQMPEKFGTLQAKIIGDWRRWLVKEGKLLDPTDPSNKEDIEANFERYFFARLFTLGQQN